MAANLEKHRHLLVLYNRTRAKAEELVGLCAVVADSPAEAAKKVRVLFTMLAHPDAVEEAALGENGFLDDLQPGSIWVDCSSVNPSFSKRMAAEAKRRNVRFVDAPVTGSAPTAAEGKLVFWVGADDHDLEAVRPLLLCMGNKIVQVGGPGSGTAMKMVINLLLGNAMAAFAEGMVLGEGLGIPRRVLFDSLFGMPAVAPFLALKRVKIEKDDYEAEFPLAWMQKDLHLASVSAYETGVALPLTNATKELYQFAGRAGHAREDFSAIYQFVATNSNSSSPVQRPGRSNKKRHNSHRNAIRV
jgi:3-hydroxyisobutyrate dehydrogenase/glyoxylate/succinic semialdehyde reductase